MKISPVCPFPTLYCPACRICPCFVIRTFLFSFFSHASYFLMLFNSLFFEWLFVFGFSILQASVFWTLCISFFVSSFFQCISVSSFSVCSVFCLSCLLPVLPCSGRGRPQDFSFPCFHNRQRDLNFFPPLFPFLKEIAPL